jgi:hypothetical protein
MLVIVDVEERVLATPNVVLPISSHPCTKSSVPSPKEKWLLDLQLKPSSGLLMLSCPYKK